MSNPSDAVVCRLTVSELLDRLEDRGALRQRASAEASLSQRETGDDMPVYLRVVSGVGAFIAAVSFIGFLALAEIIDFDSAAGMVGWGLGLAAVAIGLHRAAAGRIDSVVLAFLVQSSFFAMLAGKALFALGFTSALDSGWGAPLALAIIAAATYHAYPLTVDRFLSAFSVGCAVLVLLFVDRDVDAARSVLFNLFVVAQLAIVGQLSLHPATDRAYLPIARGLLVSLAASMLVVSAQSEMGWRYEPVGMLPVNVVLAAVLIALIGWVAGGVDRLRSEPLALACAGVVALGLVSAPGILLAIGLLVFGHARHRRFELLLGALLLPAFVFVYYYSLDLDLASKAATLVGSGALLLAGRAYLRYRALDREN